MAWRSVDIDLYTHSLDYLKQPVPPATFLIAGPDLLSMEGGGDSVNLHMQFL
jgi:hypothetical protein